MKRKQESSAGRGKKLRLPKHLEHLHANAAGIDIGSRSHFVAVPEDRDPHPVREFSSFTGDLYLMADWLQQCGIDTVAMESTGVYWIPLYEILESRGFDVRLVNARQVKNVPGRKTDVLDCQWLQQLHTYGLLNGAFRPTDHVCALRAVSRQQQTMVRYCAAHVQHMQKALIQMNILLHNVVSDITGLTGMRIIRAILAGERNSHVLASLRDGRCKNSEKIIAASLVGNFRSEHLFSLRQAVDLFEFYQGKITECDQEIARLLARFDVRAEPESAPVPKKKTKSRKLKPDEALCTTLHRVAGVDLTQIDGIATDTALRIISEVGLDMSRWPNEKHFASWLGLCPGNKVSGGKRLSGKSKPVANKAATALRLAARSLFRSQSALGAYLRRQKARLGAPKAVTATAHKLARLVYRLLKFGTEYVDAGQDYYEERYRSRVLRNLRKKAQDFGFDLVSVGASQNC